MYRQSQYLRFRIGKKGALFFLCKMKFFMIPLQFLRSTKAKSTVGIHIVRGYMYRYIFMCTYVVWGGIPSISFFLLSFSTFSSPFIHPAHELFIVEPNKKLENYVPCPCPLFCQRHSVNFYEYLYALTPHTLLDQIHW